MNPATLLSDAHVFTARPNACPSKPILKVNCQALLLAICPRQYGSTAFEKHAVRHCGGITLLLCLARLSLTERQLRTQPVGKHTTTTKN